jgi:hypothetical protein
MMEHFGMVELSLCSQRNNKVSEEIANSLVR